MSNRKVIVQAGITGSVHTPSMSPYLPITPKDIADEIVRSYEAGAATVHIHARDPETGAPSSELYLYEEILSNVKSRCDIVCGITTGGGRAMTPEERIATIKEFEPELASFNPGSFNLAIYRLDKNVEEYKHSWEKDYILGTDDYIFKNTFKDLRYFAQEFEKYDTKPEMEIFDIGMINNVALLVQEGYLKKQQTIYAQFILGMVGGQPASPKILSYLLEQAGELWGSYVWSAIIAHREQYAQLAYALALGGNIRVGLEDNLYISRGVLAKSNAEQVEKAVRIVKELGYDVASPNEAREILGLKGLDKVKY